jgi:hypothetical protein
VREHRETSPTARRAVAANITSVRTLIARMSSNVTAAPSAIPRISSRYCSPKAAIGAIDRRASSWTRAHVQPV